MLSLPNPTIIPAYWILLIPLAWFLSIRFRWFAATTFLLVPAAILYTAVNFIRWTKRITPVQDLSYGIYIWAFPIQQLVVNYLHLQNPLSILFLTTGGTLIPAMISLAFH